MKPVKIVAILIIVAITAVAGFLILFNIDIIGQLQLRDQSIQSIPETTASAITSPPPSMEGINTHTELYGTGADPDIITLGPKTGGCEGCPPYPGKTSMEFELEHGTPVLAPLDMVLIGFKNRNAEYRVRDDGEIQSPYNDLELVFESASPDWPGLIVCVYHLYTSPLLLGHIPGSECFEVEKWGSKEPALGHIFYENEEVVYRTNSDADECEGLIGRLVRRGEVIGYAGSVGDHSMAPFRFKVPDTSVNPTVKYGNRYLHWVQPGSFFYWKSYSPDAVFPAGVLAYPFPCDGYELPAEQYDVSFKYTLN